MRWEQQQLAGGAATTHQHNSVTTHQHKRTSTARQRTRNGDEPKQEKASAADLQPVKIDGTMAFMFESDKVFRPTREALSAPGLQLDYGAAWAGFTKAKLPD